MMRNRIGKGVWFFCSASWAAMSLQVGGSTGWLCLLVSMGCLTAWWTWPSK